MRYALLVAGSKRNTKVPDRLLTRVQRFWATIALTTLMSARRLVNVHDMMFRKTEWKQV